VFEVAPGRVQRAAGGTIPHPVRTA
jgi:hypothetical protein